MDDEKEDRSGENDKRGFSEIVREVTSLGLATFFMTEDSIRSYLKEKKLPKELASGLLDGIARKKEDLYELIAKEFGRVLSKIDITSEVSRFLEKHQIQLEAKVSFEPKRDGASSPGKNKEA